ncbi:hypothetical protein ACHAXR_000745 [Thalassiosira sp. AJA248-18]
MNKALRQRWHSSINCLAKQLHSQSQRQSDNSTLDKATSDAISSVANKWLDKVASLYDEPHRAYHNMNHIEDVLLSVDFLLGTGTPNNLPSSSLPEEEEEEECTSDDSHVVVVAVDMAITTLAAFFHDVIYNPKSSTNEKDSAVLFLEFASELSNVIAQPLVEDHSSDNNCVDNNNDKEQQSPTKTTPTVLQSNMISQIEECIIATATHISSSNQARESDNILLSAFLDADMSILGRDAERYDKYAGCIRKEYEFVERSVYCTKRAEILESFLPVAMDPESELKKKDTVDAPKESNEIVSEGEKRHLFLYATEKGRGVWENQARKNLQREIDMLRLGIIPCEKESL